ncbi:MAG: bifunctional folylpolyglutamate synthase/dihydrofolate synthase, partial [Lachnospiraceae bacterium]|nr:bifunctional folylpolyglutamate synthase/dihydrofolate synthase [Lachnospiraceae bacterium]
MMTVSEEIAYIENYTWSTSKMGLERTQELLAKMGDPQKKLKFVHITGSNGKGSTCAMTASVLTAAGYRTGMYTSPHVCDFNERMQIDGAYIDDEALAEITEYVAGIADGMEDHPSQFELVTAIAMEYFYREKCDIVMLEVGMGGALDSTNVIDAPVVAAFTNIGLEHTEYLGNTLTEIAKTKAGIIKKGCHVICYDSEPEAVDTIREICKEMNVPFTLVSKRAELLNVSTDGQKFRYRDKIYEIGLLGEHQLRNAEVALEILKVLDGNGFPVTLPQLQKGLAETKWPARFEVLKRDPLFILDGGHNPQCALALTETLNQVLPGQKV